MTTDERPVVPATPVRLKIRRQDAADKPESRRWEEFRVSCDPAGTLLDALRQIQRQPVTVGGQSVPPVAWESNCNEEVCGACTMRVDGKARPACAVRVEELASRGRTVVLEPLAKFPLVRDLVVDRRRVLDSFGKVGAWATPSAEVTPNGAGDARNPGLSERDTHAVPINACTACGACLEACPQYSADGDYVGAAALHQVAVFHLATSVGATGARLDPVMGSGGVADCGKAHNCARVCPANIPLVDSIQTVARAASKRLLFGWLLGSE